MCSSIITLTTFAFVGTSTKAFFRGLETWNKETIMKKVIMNHMFQM